MAGAAAQQYFETKGLSKTDSWILAAIIKSDNSDPVDNLMKLQAWTTKHVTSAQNHRLIARFTDAAARLSLRKPDESLAQIMALTESELAERSGHKAVVDKLEDDKKKVEELFSQGRKERSAGFMRCGKCKSTEVDVEQKQTRSADEPMTLFALCTNCGARWTMK